MSAQPTTSTSAVDTPTSHPPPALGYSLVLGVAYALGWLAFAAVRAQDGRMPVTDWTDPVLAGATLAVVLLAMVALIALWAHLPASRARTFTALVLVVSEWTYITGEVLSNTITIGEPPRDVGGLLEIASGLGTILGVVTLALAMSRTARRQRRTTAAITVVAAVLAAGMTWWFGHPIDQSTPGAPDCVRGNALYNITHGADC